MGSYKLIIKDFDECPCDVQGCDKLANQYTIIVRESTGKVQKYCTKHQTTQTQESQS